MRYSQDHRSATKAKIVTAASRSMRSKGPDGIAVAAVMAEVGLTLEDVTETAGESAQ